MLGSVIKSYKENKVFFAKSDAIERKLISKNHENVTQSYIC